MKKILVVGSLNMDMVLSVDHHPVPGETIIGDRLSYHSGGKGANHPDRESGAGWSGYNND